MMPTVFLLLLLCLHAANATTTTGVTSLLPVDENKRLSENILLIRSTASSKWKKAQAIGRRTIISSSTQDDDLYFPQRDYVANCLWKGFPIDYVKDSINLGKEKESVKQFFDDKCNHLEMGFISYFDDEILNITWIDPETNELTENVQTLKAWERNTEWIHTVPSHEFQVKGKKFEKIFKAEVPSIFTIGQKPDYTTLGRTITEANKLGRIRQELSRVRLIKRVFTDVGFKKIKVPRDVWAEIST
jgi:hypothetical protein